MALFWLVFQVQKNYRKYSMLKLMKGYGGDPHKYKHVITCHIPHTTIPYTSFFPKIDNSGSISRIVLEQNKFSQKVTFNRDGTLDPRTLVALLLQSHAFQTMLICIA